MILQRLLVVQFIGEEKYRPTTIDPKRSYPVIGYETRKNVREFEQKKREFSEVDFLVIGEDLRPATIPGFNCKVAIDKSSTDRNEVLQLLSNVVSMLKVLTERINSVEKSKDGNNENNGQVDSKEGKKPPK